MSSSGASATTTAISSRIRRTPTSTKNAATSAAAVAAVQSTAATVLTVAFPTSNVARNRHGSVTMSPMAVTIGVDTASRSQPLRNDITAMPTVNTSAINDARTPPTTEIVTRSQKEITASLAKADATSVAMAAR